MHETKWLRLKFEQLQILHQDPTVEAYYSVTFNEKFYFSSVFDDELTLEIKNDMIIPLDGSPVDTISLQRWQSHVIVFDHDISLNELKKKSIIKKNFQARKNQIITFSVILCTEKDLIYCDTLLRKVNQHYLILENVRLKDQSSQKRADYGACYFKITTSKNEFDIPVVNGNCLIYLPQTFQISQYRNGKFYSKSKLFTFDQINESFQEISLYTESDSYAGKVTFDARWVVDVSIPSPMDYLLLHSVEIMISDIELKFDVPNDFIGSKIKIYCNNKVFEFNDELGNSKMIKIKKAAWIVCKTPHDNIEIKIERNNEAISRIDILVEELHFCQMIKFKQRLVDATNPLKPMGQIRFNLQKTKGLTSPQHDTFWKECLKRKSTGSILIEQLSICYDEDEIASITIKTQTEQKTVSKLSNINFFEEEPLIYHNPVLMNTKSQDTLYFMVKAEHRGNSNPSDDFIGIAVLNNSDLKLGRHPYEVEFYKNQEKLGTVNCLITKFLPFTFVKSIFHPDIFSLNKIVELKLSLNTLTLSPYFFSYKYDRQSEVFCIVEVNRVKKVLILQPTFQELSFVPASTSDNLSFSVDADEILKLKVTIMIGDGLTEEIYGSTSMTLRMEELRQKQEIIKKDTQFTNFAQTFVGKCNLVICLQNVSIKRIQKQKSKEKLPFQSNRNRSSHSKKEKEKQRKSISVIQMLSPQQRQIKVVKNLLPIKKHARYENSHGNFSLDKNGTADSKQISRFEEREPVKLPLIREKKRKQSFGDLLMSMNVRKRTLGGYDYNRGQEEDKSMSYNLGENKANSGRTKQKAIDYQNLRNGNPNIDRNFQILFPPKKGQTRQQQIKNELNKYEQKLRGLKSVLNEISNDIEPIEPSVKENNNTDSLSRGGETNNFEYAGNEFL